MRRDVLFFGSQKYNRLFSNLPNTMRPFSDLAPNTEKLPSTLTDRSATNNDEPVEKRQKTG
jgi:hypothetical protein